MEPQQVGAGEELLEPGGADRRGRRLPGLVDQGLERVGQPVDADDRVIAGERRPLLADHDPGVALEAVEIAEQAIDLGVGAGGLLEREQRLADGQPELLALVDEVADDLAREQLERRRRDRDLLLLVEEVDDVERPGAITGEDLLQRQQLVEPGRERAARRRVDLGVLGVEQPADQVAAVERDVDHRRGQDQPVLAQRAEDGLEVVGDVDQAAEADAGARPLERVHRPEHLVDQAGVLGRSLQRHQRVIELEQEVGGLEPERLEEPVGDRGHDGPTSSWTLSTIRAGSVGLVR